MTLGGMGAGMDGGNVHDAKQTLVTQLCQPHTQLHPESFPGSLQGVTFQNSLALDFCKLL